MDFLKTFEILCERKGVSPTRALLDAGLSKSLYTKWKDKPEFIPNGLTLDKLSKYFVVSIDFLQSNPFGAEPTDLEGMPEIAELVRASKKMSPEIRRNILMYAKFLCPEAFNEMQEL